MNEDIENLLNDLSDDGDDTPKGRNKGFLGRFKKFLTGTSDGEKKDERNDFESIEEPPIIQSGSEGPKSTPAPPPFVNKPTSPLEVWAVQALQQFDDNISAIEALQTSLSGELTHGSARHALNTNQWAHKAFEESITQGFAQSIQNNTSTLGFDKPPILKHHFHPYASSDYNYLTNLEGKPYQLRIVSRLPIEALSYVKGEYLEAYQAVKGMGRWCFPDRRLQGIPQSVTDSLALSFKKFEQTFLEKVADYDEDDKPDFKHPDTTLLSMFALALVFDCVSVNHLPKKQKTLDLDKGAGECDRHITIQFNGETRIGKDAIRWEHIAENAWIALQKQESDDLFAENNPIDSLLIIEQAKSQLFSLFLLSETAEGNTKDFVKAALNQAHQIIDEGLSTNLEAYNSEESEREIEFRQGVMHSIVNLSVEYKEQLEKRNKQYPNPDDIPPKPLPVND